MCCIVRRAEADWWKGFELISINPVGSAFTPTGRGIRSESTSKVALTMKHHQRLFGTMRTERASKSICAKRGWEYFVVGP